MQKQNIHALLTQLHNELEDIQSVDENDRRLLTMLKSDIQNVLDHRGINQSRQHNSLITQLTKAIHYFEKAHPTLTLTMKQVIDTLSNMGI
ncbi:MAG: DUF4404 family protein [bacterium]